MIHTLHVIFTWLMISTGFGRYTLVGQCINNALVSVHLRDARLLVHVGDLHHETPTPYRCYGYSRLASILGSVRLFHTKRRAVRPRGSTFLENPRVLSRLLFLLFFFLKNTRICPRVTDACHIFLVR